MRWTAALMLIALTTSSAAYGQAPAPAKPDRYLLTVTLHGFNNDNADARTAQFEILLNGDGQPGTFQSGGTMPVGDEAADFGVEGRIRVKPRPNNKVLVSGAFKASEVGPLSDDFAVSHSTSVHFSRELTLGETHKLFAAKPGLASAFPDSLQPVLSLFKAPAQEPQAGEVDVAKEAVPSTPWIEIRVVKAN